MNDYWLSLLCRDKDLKLTSSTCPCSCEELRSCLCVHIPCPSAISCLSPFEQLFRWPCPPTLCWVRQRGWGFGDWWSRWCRSHLSLGRLPFVWSLLMCGMRTRWFGSLWPRGLAVWRTYGSWDLLGSRCLLRRHWCLSWRWCRHLFWCQWLLRGIAFWAFRIPYKWMMIDYWLLIDDDWFLIIDA